MEPILGELYADIAGIEPRPLLLGQGGFALAHQAGTVCGDEHGEERNEDHVDGSRNDLLEEAVDQR